MSTDSSRTESTYYEEDKLLGEDSLQPSSPRCKRDRKCSNFFVTALFVLATILTATSTFFLGALYGRGVERTRKEQGDWKEVQDGVVSRVPLGIEIKTFHLDKAFTTIPEKAKLEPSWDSLIPNGLGYINNTALAPGFSVVSAFHQLHCLYTLRRAYYAGSEQDLQEFDFGHDRSEHVVHCFEYLRQSIMCSADSSIEPAEGAGRHGHTFLGWDVPRQCRNYDELKAWAEQRRAFDGHGFLAKDVNTGSHRT